MSHENQENPLPPDPDSAAGRWGEIPSSLSWPDRFERAMEKLDQARRRIRELERKNGELRNENETLCQPQIPSLVRPSGSHGRRHRKLGPKEGHRAYVRTLPSAEKINREVKIAPESCPRCHTAELPLPSTWHSHTQINIPDTHEVEITRFQVGYSYCRQCHTLIGSDEKQKRKAGMLPYSKYGPRLHAYVSYWKYGLGMSLGKIRTELAEGYGIQISRGQITEMLENCAEKLEDIYADIRRVLRGQHHVHADETGWRSAGENFWLWSFSNECFSYYRIEKSRGGRIVRNTLGKKFSGILISDFYSAYSDRSIQCRKQKCWVHLMRDARQVREAYPKNEEVRSFCKKLKSFFRRGLRMQKAFQGGVAIERGHARLENETRQFYQQSYQHPDLAVLAKRMKRHQKALYTFIKTGVAPTNNSAEQEIRPAVLMRKTQFCNRSAQGTHTQEILMSVIRTCFKRNINYLDLATQYLISR